MEKEKKILLVDDEPDFIEMMTERLEANNYRVIPARDGKEALEKVRQDKPDLIVLDIMIPEIDGFEVCRRLKIDKDYKDIPVLMLTVRFKAVDIKFGKALGADAYLTKPVDSKILIYNIKRLLKNKK